MVFLTTDGHFAIGEGENRRLRPELIESATGGVLEWFEDIQGWFEASGRSGTPGCRGTTAPADPERPGAVRRQRDRRRGAGLCVGVGAQVFEATIMAAALPVEIVRTSLVEVPGDAARFLARITIQVTVTATIRSLAGERSLGGNYNGRVTVEAEAFYDCDADVLDAVGVEVTGVGECRILPPSDQLTRLDPHAHVHRLVLLETLSQSARSGSPLDGSLNCPASQNCQERCDWHRVRRDTPALPLRIDRERAHTAAPR